ncbi:hypothetical protein D1B33_06110 [Lysinibacillus yapensis]|uniref:DUF3888 domain-containing protein n=1 Tax=Ureibacillus yapensis TaxID=2304605 RepID=A0A396SBE6_9BACL|nr:hypothetical protein [Lysinibacillus yapensis]RHW38452.1 hypothetical protein D1B33_06110 [Lysinibacillus yapensis]
MKKIAMLFILIAFTFPGVVSGNSLTPNCPNPESLMETSVKDKDNLIEVLNELIPKVYGSSLDYKEWKIEVIEPMPRLIGHEEVYYHMAINFCGKKVAEHSWFVRLRFPRLLPAQSASLGELFIAKDANNKWSAWFRYH